MENNSLAPTWTYCPDNQLQINSVAINDDGSKCVFGTSFERGSGHFNTYLYDGSGNKILKKAVSTEETYQGVFWVDVCANGEFFVSGGETSKSENYQTTGFLKAYNAITGDNLLNISMSSRVNQVSLSKDGQYLVVCFGSTLEIYCLNSTHSSYVSIGSESLGLYNINSCMISRDGSTVVASGIKYNDDDSTSGKVFSYSVSDNVVTLLGNCEPATGCMRVAIVDSGQFWAASLHDGSCMMIHRDSPTVAQWHCSPDNSNLMLAYALDITQTEAGDVFVACGANLDSTVDGGFLYLVKSVRMDYADYPAVKYQGVLQWSNAIKYGVNPGVSMDLNATYVSATDGKPDGNSINESSGSFYLYSAGTGDLLWKYDTSMMNWPMMLSRDGKSVFGGSDDGSVYYWKLSTN